MNNCYSNSKYKSKRNGAAAVEAAILLPLLIVVSFGAIDVAQYINLSQLVTNASREGARVASRNTTQTVGEVETAVASFMSEALAHLSESELADAINVDVRCGETWANVPDRKMDSIPSGDPVSVHISFDFDKVRWLSGPSYWNDNVQESKTFCRRE